MRAIRPGCGRSYRTHVVWVVLTFSFIIDLFGYAAAASVAAVTVIAVVVAIVRAVRLLLGLH